MGQLHFMLSGSGLTQVIQCEDLQFPPFISIYSYPHMHSVGSVPTQYRPLSDQYHCCVWPYTSCRLLYSHSGVSDLWPLQPAGRSVFFYAICLLFFYFFSEWGTQLEEVSKPDRLWQTINCLTWMMCHAQFCVLRHLWLNRERIGGSLFLHLSNI